MTAVRLLPAGCVVLSVAVAGLLFAPVFELAPLLLPVGVVAAVVFAVASLCSGRESLSSWRPVLALVAGLLAVVETVLWPTTAAGLPTGETFDALVAGLTDSWRLALQSTWPARPDATAMLFVPLLVLLAGVLGIELLHRLGNPLVALAPGFAVLVLSQFYAALSGMAAVLAVLAYTAVAGTLFAVTRTDHVTDKAGARRRWLTSAALRAAPMAVLAVVCALVAGLLAPGVPPVYSLKEDQGAPLASTKVTSPLDEIAERLTHPGTPVFKVTGGEGVDRWPLAVLDTFDGVNWTAAGQYRRLGAELRPGAAVTVGVKERSAEIQPIALNGPWLPSQTWPAGVSGFEPLVEEQRGTLLADGSSRPKTYTLRWWEPQTTKETLAQAEIDPVPGGLDGGVGTAPPDMAAFADRAVNGLRSTFEAALVLERFFRDNYRVATRESPPTGHAWPNLDKFLRTDKRGTTEQFAAAYVALARMVGIPARLVVGFRAPPVRPAAGTYTVHNEDVLAWPEVAVKQVGWVPLDPSPDGAAAGPGADTGLAAAAARARAVLPPAKDLQSPPVAPSAQAADAGDGSGFGGFPIAVLVGVAVLLLLAWLGGVPAVTAWRSWRRRRRTGTGAVIGAWEEARDRLRAHGIGVSAGMTVRDLAAVSAGVGGPGTADGLRALASTVDYALWTGSGAGEQAGRDAWAAVRVVRRGLAARGWRSRLRATFALRNLLPTRKVSSGK